MQNSKVCHVLQKLLFSPIRILATGASAMGVTCCYFGKQGTGLLMIRRWMEVIELCGRDREATRGGGFWGVDRIAEIPPHSFPWPHGWCPREMRRERYRESGESRLL
jgi:hypothetical protein